MNNVWSVIKHLLKEFWKLLILIIIIYIGLKIFEKEYPVPCLVAEKITDIVVIGVIWAMIVDGGQLMGVFKRELEVLLYGEEFMAEGLKLDKIWYNLSRKLCKEKFGDLQPKLFETLRKYFPKDKCYYERYDFHTTIAWEDDSTRERMRVTDTVTIVLAPDDDAAFTHKITVRTPIADRLRYSSEIREMKINSEPWNVEGKYDNNGTNGGWSRNIYELSLGGKNKYKIEYTRVSTYSFNDDNCKGVIAQYIVKNMTVSLTLPDGLEAFFVDGGTLHGFEDVRQGDQRRIEKKSKGIILPHQGYMFVLTRKHLG